MALSGKDDDISRLTVMDRVGDRLFTIRDLYIFSICFCHSDLDIIDDGLWILISRII